ncbi:alpha/beta hydrolase family esterase [Stieleria varia]|uniref:Esterase PHB depolymerase n=1 Tax=Stieleria varia TaxID=2528005 RepID=A0A5C6B235_9BACT|nr:PHB depolymerase family esterase [Stieleria varia]TWU05631.1 Esterase PHB depolymerase [Stieleria varia]
MRFPNSSARQIFVAHLSLGLALLLAVNVDAQESKDQTTRHTLISESRERTYNVYVPTTLDRDKPAPLLLCFHGAGGSGLAEMIPFRRLAKQHGFLLVGPDGINGRWNAGCDDEIKATAGADDVGFVRDLVQEIRNDFKVDSRRIYAYGFSNGAAIGHRLAAELPDTFAAVAAVGGTLARNSRDAIVPGPAVSMLIMVGSEDSMFGTNGDLRKGTFFTATETARIWSERNECSVSVDVETPVPFTRWTNPTDNVEVELWIVQGAGHTPNMSKAFDTAEESWKFLSRER